MRDPRSTDMERTIIQIAATTIDGGEDATLEQVTAAIAPLGWTVDSDDGDGVFLIDVPVAVWHALENSGSLSVSILGVEIDAEMP